MNLTNKQAEDISNGIHTMAIAIEKATESANTFSRLAHASFVRALEIKHLKIKRLTLGLTFLEQQRLKR